MASQAAELRKFQLQMQAELERRIRLGLVPDESGAHVTYQKRPLDWIVEKLGVPEHTLRWSMNPGYDKHNWDGDEDPLLKILQELAAGKNVGVEAGTGTNKTFTAACIVMWFLGTFPNALVMTTAPREKQLSLNLWKEIRRLFPKFKKHFPNAELYDLNLRMNPSDPASWAAVGIVSGVGADEEVATRMAGIHEEHMLWVMEELPGMDRAVTAAIEHTCTAPHNLRLGLGNPDHQHDELHRFCTSPGVTHIRISALDHPNVVAENPSLVPGAVSRESVERRRIAYGDGGRLYSSRIRGISPPEAEDALIKWEWCVRAAARYDDPRYRVGKPALGVDVANSEGGDKGAISRWEGSCCTEVPDFPCPDANLLGKQVGMEMTARGISHRNVGVDEVGVGAGTKNELKRLGHRVRGISSGSRAIPGLDDDMLMRLGIAQDADDEAEQDSREPTRRVVLTERFDNQRSQAWWQMREDLRLDKIALPNDEALFRDLTAPSWTTRDGKICVEKKEESIKRLKRSPNKGDAAVYGCFVRDRAPLPSSAETVAVKASTALLDTGLERLLARESKRKEVANRHLQRALRRNDRRKVR